MPCGDDRMLPECANEFSHIRTEFDRHYECLSDIKEAVCGNGKPGLNTRVDRLEQREADRKWFNRTVLGAVVVLLVKAGYEFLGGT